MAIVVVGGGRWARVYLRILQRLGTERIVVVSRHGGPDLQLLLAELNAGSAGWCELAATLEDATNRERPRRAIVVNAARAHARTAAALLDRGIPVLLEKPLALDTSEVEMLVRSSTSANAALVPALVFRHATYLALFGAAVRREIRTVASIDVRWEDPLEETRHGATKTADAELGAADDIGWHVHSLLETVFGLPSASVHTASIARGGMDVELNGTVGAATLRVRLSRAGDRRTRMISVRDTNEAELLLDFAKEPGTITGASRSGDADPAWGSRPSPLTQLVRGFIERAEGAPAASDIGILRRSSSFVFDAAEKVRGAQRALVRASRGSRDRGGASVALRELLTASLVREGLVAPGEKQRLHALAQRAAELTSGAAARDDVDARIQRLLEIELAPPVRSDSFD